MSAVPEMTKKQLRKLRKKQKAAVASAQAPLLIAKDIPQRAEEDQKQSSGFNSSTSATENVLEVAGVPNLKDDDPLSPGDPSSKLPQRTIDAIEWNVAPRFEEWEPPAELLKSSVYADSERYDSLAALKAHKLSHIIAVVTQECIPKIAQSGEWMCKLELADPTITNLRSTSSSETFLINCFAKKYKEWLPQPLVGDVIVLKYVKIVTFNGNLRGTGYSDRLRWAIFSPKSGKIRHGELGSVPEFEPLADHHSYIFSPFFQPGEEVIKRCISLSDWWSEMTKIKKPAGEECHDIGLDSETLLRSRKAMRRHLFISEAGPEVPPNGFFNCTVEVLHSHSNDNNVYSVYVTDYTRHPAATPVQSAWCPKKLSDYVLKIEMWDAAAAKARTMATGEYYYIKNARMRLSRGGHVEGKVVEDKIFQLENKQDSFLGALLERKAAWESANTDVIEKKFEDFSIRDAPEGEHFNCIVEVLHLSDEQNSIPSLYVTDYTIRRNLHSQASGAQWALGLEGRVLRIMLHGNQADMSRRVQIGSICRINKLRIKQSQSENQLQGMLGGQERLILSLDPDSEPAIQLKSRKAELRKAAQVSECQTSAMSFQPESQSRGPIVKRRSERTILQIKNSKKCPNKFRILARVVDFRPLDLRDAVLFRCKKCDNIIQKTLKACVDCGDFDHEFIEGAYQIYFKLQDEEENELVVSLNDNCNLFEGLKRSDLSEDKAAYGALISRLKPMIAGLGTANVRDTPFLSLIINSWKVQEETAYCLERCDESPR